MNIPDKIYLHKTIDAESGQHLGYEWHPHRNREDDVCYIHPRLVWQLVDEIIADSTLATSRALKKFGKRAHDKILFID